MRKLRGKIVGVTTLVLGMLVVPTSALVLSTPGAAYAAAYDDQWADETSCGNSAITARVATLSTGKVELRYSTGCRTIWSRVTVYRSALIVDPFAWAVRNTDGRHTAGINKCYTDGAGNFVCYSPMLNDAGVTSYAAGEWTSIDGYHTTRTSSY